MKPANLTQVSLKVYSLRRYHARSLKYIDVTDFTGPQTLLLKNK